MSDLQFETAEYGDAPTCAVCGASTGDPFWMAGPKHVCAGCHERLESALGAPATWADLGRAALFGTGAAAAGAALWYGVRAASGAEWGIVAIAVSWLVAWAVRRGGGGSLGQQLLAAGLTYVAVVSTWVPMLYADASAEVAAPLAAAVAVVVALILPLEVARQGDVLWFVILGIALWGAFRRAARPQIAWTGPFHAAAPAPPAP